MYTPEELDRIWIHFEKRMIAACQIGEYKRYIITRPWQVARNRLAIMQYDAGMISLLTFRMLCGELTSTK